jgi:hypothetical protein
MAARSPLAAARRGAAAFLGLVLPSLLGCASLAVYTSPGSDAEGEGVCAWFGDTSDDVLYFGESAFWHELRRHGGDPLADLRGSEPRRIGRFQLRRERILRPLELGEGRSGVWDVLLHPNGRVYFTTGFEEAGFVDLATAEVRMLPALGRGLNELALGPDDSVLATRYADESRTGAVVAFDPDGRLLLDRPLDPPRGYDAAAKSIAYDPVRGEIWVNTDLFPRGGDPAAHDARVFDRGGRELSRWDTPELQFMTFAPDGTGYAAEASGARLTLRVIPPGAATPPQSAGRSILLDAAFPGWLDAVQDLRVARDGRVVVTRWSGQVHVVGRRDAVTTLELPRPTAEGMYYTGVLTGGRAWGERVCASYCGGVRVACESLR